MVLDASALIEVLLRTRPAAAVEQRLFVPDPSRVASD